MVQYAGYDPAQSPSPVSGWYDTDEFDYANLPAASDLLAVTADQWAARLANPSGWAVENGALTAYTPPVPTPTLEQEAGMAMLAGLTLSLSGSLTLPATLFPTDPTTQTKIAAVITTLIATDAFPGGAASYPMKDATGAWHSFSAGQYKTVAGAIATYAAALDLIIDGNPTNATALPDASAALVV